jgi:hypothetical protein
VDISVAVATPKVKIWILSTLYFVGFCFLKQNTMYWLAPTPIIAWQNIKNYDKIFHCLLDRDIECKLTRFCEKQGPCQMTQSPDYCSQLGVQKSPSSAEIKQSRLLCRTL